VNYTEILDARREFTSRERIEFLPLAPEARPVSDYAPNFRRLTGTTRAFPNIKRILGRID
jgi:hypothetical protein